MEATNSNEQLSMPESSDRPLAYVETIKALNPIEGADVIEVATVLGWKVIVKKGLYNVGDSVVYCEIDSVLPPWEYFVQDKLDKANFRIKTIKLRGQVSQGYCIPIKALTTHPNRKVELLQVESKKQPEQKVNGIKDLNTGDIITLDIGTDLTSWIGIKKYEIPDVGVQVGGKTLTKFPEFLRKTDQPRIQNLPEYLEKHADVEFEITEKLEGSSISVFYRNSRFGVCSRNFELKIEDNNESVALKTVIGLGIKEALEGYGKNIALQGELIGPGIQGNIYKLPTHDWRVYDIWLIDELRYATPDEREEILKHMKLHDRLVPVIEKRTLKGLEFDQLLKMAEGFSKLKKDVQREGIVFKSNKLYNGHTVSFKAISNVYLLKKDSK